MLEGPVELQDGAGGQSRHFMSLVVEAIHILSDEPSCCRVSDDTDSAKTCRWSLSAQRQNRQSEMGWARLFQTVSP
jgi:hypothetical protein